MTSMQVLSALTDVRDSFVLESALPPVKQKQPLSPPRRRGIREASMGRVFSEGWLVAAICILVALGTVGGMIYLGQNPPVIPPVHTDGLTLPETRDDLPVTEGMTAASLVYVSHGDGTCSVKASSSFGARDEDTHLVIPATSPTGETVTAVADYGFLWKDTLVSVTLPDTVTSIGQWGFAECGALERVELSENLTAIGTAAFLECGSLASLHLPEGLTFLGDSAFSTCTALAEVSIPSTLKSIPQWAFYGCTSLTRLSSAEGLTEIGYSAFCGCTGLTEIELPSTLREIGKGSFAGCTALRSVELPEGLVSLGKLAFDGCTRLTRVTLPASLHTLEEEALRDCTALRHVTYRASREAWYTLTGGAWPLPASCILICTDGNIKP